MSIPTAPPSPPDGEQLSPEAISEKRAEAQAAAQRALVNKASSPETAKEMTPTEERGVLSFLLGPPTPIDFNVVAKITTPDSGEEGVDCRFVVRTVPDKLLRSIDDRYSRISPDGTQDVDAAKIAAATFWEALVSMEDPETGNAVAKASIDLRAPNGAPLDGTTWVESQFMYQFGIVEQLAIRVREISGWSSDRVGRASRLAVNAALGR